MKFIDGARVPIYSWCDDIEESAMKQIINIANLPFTTHHVAIMPDCHTGYGMPIGGVLATKGVVIPNAVGYDIACGMLAVHTGWKAEQLGREELLRVFGGSAEYHGGIRSSIPVGFNHHSKNQDESWMPTAPTVRIVATGLYHDGLKQVGTLGGGNHFIEFQRDTDGDLWYMIHSGSRGIGHKIATIHNEIAKALNAKWHTAVPPEHDLAFLPLDSDEGASYIEDMEWCVRFAERNRALMSSRVYEALAEVLGDKPVSLEVNIAHNYAIIEHHNGEDVIVHRKGATSARLGEMGIIPGSQGSKSYIVRGLGNYKSYNSCSHGAGRKMGRKEAVRTLDIAEERAKLEAMGVLMHGMRSEKELDEAPGAYKDIDVVMKAQEDLVEIVHTLAPIAVMKG